jgi:hypothetical protein
MALEQTVSVALKPQFQWLFLAGWVHSQLNREAGFLAAWVSASRSSATALPTKARYASYIDRAGRIVKD